MSDQAVRLIVDPARLQRERTAVIVMPALMIALGVVYVVGMGGPGLWMASLFAIYLGPFAVVPVRRFVWARRFLGKEVRLDDEGLTVTKDGRVEAFIAWDDITSIGDESILTIRSRRAALTLVPEMCTEPDDFVLAVRRIFHDREIVRRLSFADVRGDAIWAGVWMLALLATWVVPATYLIRGLMLIEDIGERTHWIVYVANALTAVVPLAGVAGGLRFSYSWGSHRIGRGLLFPSVAAVIAVVWTLAVYHNWFMPWELAWRSLLAAVLVAAGAYVGGLGGRYKLWSRDHVDRETGAASLPEDQIMRPCRRWVLLSLAGLVGVCMAAPVAGVPSILFAPAGPLSPVAASVVVLVGLALIGFFIWCEVQLIGTLRHQAMRVSADAFEYWDWRGRHFTIPWGQIASIDALDRQGVVRVHYAADGESAKVDLSDTIAWHKGLETQILRLFRERAQLTREEPLLRGKMTAGKRYTRGDGAEGAS